jgi:hypothetical protein
MTGLVPCSSNSSRQLSAIIRFVAKNELGWLYSADQTLCDWTIVCVASGQQNSDQPPLSICKCMDLRIAPSARAANSLLLLPPFPPAASGVLLRVSSQSSGYPCIFRSWQCPGTGFPRCRASPSERSGYRSSLQDHIRAGNRTSGNRFSKHAQSR